MEKYKAIGVVETLYFTIALELLDEMLKAADVEFLHKESALGGKLVTLFVGGTISAVTEAIKVVKEIGHQKRPEAFKNAIVITNPHKEIMKYVVPKDASITD